MKVIVSIIASKNDIYNEFKKIWIKAIKEIKQSNLRNMFDFYFVYSSTDSSVENEYYTDFNDAKSIFDRTTDNSIITKSILLRSIALFKYINQKYDITHNSNGLYILRTNLSTFFDFKKLHNWLLDKPKTNFLSGSINGFYNFEHTTLSGTNMLFSIDIMLFLIDNYLQCDLTFMLEDEAISQLIIKHLSVFLINIKRIDFIEMEKVVLIDHIWPETPHSIIYHKCKMGDTNIFCFRFKTFNRNDDIKKMSLLECNLQDNNFELNSFINRLSSMYNPKLNITEEAGEYSINYSERPFKIINLKLS